MQVVHVEKDATAELNGTGGGSALLIYWCGDQPTGQAELPFDNEGRLSASDIGAGASMAFRREAFERVGYFDERLAAGAAGCSGNSEFWYRLLAAGWRCRYEPTAVAHHYHRRTVEALARQIRAYARPCDSPVYSVWTHA